MKKILFFLLLCFIPNLVYAKDILINELEVLNGELSPYFDKYNTEYTIILENSEFNVDFNYKVEEGIIVSVNNNHDLENDSVVTLTISENEEKLDYNFHILKSINESTIAFSDSVKMEENNFMFKYKLYIIPSICILLIFICYKILFRKHKKKII